MPKIYLYEKSYHEEHPVFEVRVEANNAGDFGFEVSHGKLTNFLKIQRDFLKAQRDLLELENEALKKEFLNP